MRTVWADFDYPHIDKQCDNEEINPTKEHRMDRADQFRINLSLVSHTNIGKTTLARTLLMQDIGTVEDRAHVTEDADGYVLARDASGCELLLWDTPGFGNSIALAKRLQERQNPIGWFLAEVWDRFTNKSFWLDQKALLHVRDTSTLVLYLVNATELPQPDNYIPAEMQILRWMGKPVIVLLNQLGKPQPPEKEAAQLEAWKKAMAPYPFVSDILPMDAFARCWVQEAALFEAIAKALSEDDRPTFRSLEEIWIRGRRAIYSNSIAAMAQHLMHLVMAKEVAPTPSIKDHVLAFATQLGLSKSRNAALEAAQSALAASAADRLCLLTQKLIKVNGLKEGQTSHEILRRMKTDWALAEYGINPSTAASIGAAAGIASGAVAGAAVDAASAGLTIGLGTLVGGLIGALGGVGAVAIYNAQHEKDGIAITWSTEALGEFLTETVLLYLAVAHFGRGRGEWKESESPAFWKTTVEEAIAKHPIAWRDLRKCSPDEGVSLLSKALDETLRDVFNRLYGRQP